MDIDKIIARVRNLREAAPTNSTGDGIANYQPMLWKQAVDQDYQSPGESGLAKYRYAGVYAVDKFSLDDIDSMVAASNEYINAVEEGKNSRAPIRNLGEEMVGGAPTNSVGGGHIAGTAPAGDDPPVRKRKRKRTPNGRVGSRKMWLDFTRNM
jgi:hypothetical protein